MYKLSIEQALICLRDIFHFIELDQDKTLDLLTTSSLVKKSIVMCSTEIEKFASIIGIRNLTKCSDFLKELQVIGAKMQADWLKATGADGQAILDAYNK